MRAAEIMEPIAEASPRLRCYTLGALPETIPDREEGHAREEK